MKLSPNNTCPCGSKNKYKKCCQPFHKGANPKNVLELMKARYSAYVSRETMYIVKTTHWTNPQYKEDKKVWAKDILEFCKSTQFIKLEVLEYSYNTVTFKAYTEQGILYEKSQFDLMDGKWYYIDGDVYS